MSLKSQTYSDGTRAENIEITPAMMEAGLKAYALWDRGDDREWIVVSVYREMERARAGAPLEAGASAPRTADHFSPEMRARLNEQRAEEWKRFGPMLDAMLLKAQSLRLREGHKARERTLRSLETDRASQNHSQAEE